MDATDIASRGYPPSTDHPRLGDGVWVSEEFGRPGKKPQVSLPSL